MTRLTDEELRELLNCNFLSASQSMDDYGELGPGAMLSEFRRSRGVMQDVDSCAMDIAVQLGFDDDPEEQEAPNSFYMWQDDHCPVDFRGLVQRELDHRGSSKKVSLITALFKGR